jgi:hypothetical protein
VACRNAAASYGLDSVTGAAPQQQDEDDGDVTRGGAAGAASALLLGIAVIAACGSNSVLRSAQQPSEQPSPLVARSPTVTASPASPTSPTTSSAVGRCRASILSARLGSRAAVADTGGQYQVPVVFTNMGDRPCTLRGWPAVELRGPNDPNGPTYQLSQSPATPKVVTLPVGGTAEALVTYLKYEAGDIGSLGSTDWTPTSTAVTPPGVVGALIMPWATHDPVLRQDGASHPGSYVGPVVPG